ncbi:hypothetical protein [Ruegeria arenilitoris]|uniref:hypothetical protein n=1 Tax=Ruegeria arenilitoris TaxID=1173585 RepID=UPI0014811216|nr:hypothetical protein [Ruegeria arenilitoris]
MRLSGLLLLVIGTLTASIVAPRPAEACAVCIEMPETSLADHLLSADAIVLAGPGPDNPFMFVPKEILKGTAQDIARLPEIPFLIDSTTRAAFRADPQKAVLLTYGATDKDAAGRSVSRKWRRIFMLTPERTRFLQVLNSAEETWQLGDIRSADRIAFFAAYISHQDRVLRDTALIEIDRAPYDLVRSLRIKVPTEQMLQEFRDINRIGFVPVSIRLLGLQTDDTEAVSIVRSRYRHALSTGSSYLYEWALAGIEVDGSNAVAAIDGVLGTGNRKMEDRRALVRALAEGGSVSPKLRGQIIQIFSRILNHDSALALDIAIASRDWGETLLDDQFKALLELEDTDPATRFVIETWLAPQE